MSTKQKPPPGVAPREDVGHRKSASFSTPPGEQFYRCPACGEMVDGSDREAVRRHHDHVRNPSFYARRR